VAIQRMEKHWERARVDARIEPDSGFTIHTTNVAELMLQLPSDSTLLSVRSAKIKIDGQQVTASWAKSDHTRTILLRKDRGKWTDAHNRSMRSLTKVPGLQGPIDDAFMDSFLFVRPTGRAANPKVGAWVDSAMTRATNEWREQFRGFVRIKNDVHVSKDDIATANLVLWGDPQSNKLLGRIAKKLPVQWDAKSVGLAGKNFDSASHVPLLIYPNPLNPRRYVVLNSGFTFAYEGAASNAKQTPKLPDYAILSIDGPVAGTDERRDRDIAPYRGVIQAGFFDESWKIN